MSVVMDIHGNYIDTDYNVEVHWLESGEVIQLDDNESMLEYYDNGTITHDEMIEYGFEEDELQKGR